MSDAERIAELERTVLRQRADINAGQTMNRELLVFLRRLRDDQADYLQRLGRLERAAHLDDRAA